MISTPSCLTSCWPHHHKTDLRAGRCWPCHPIIITYCSTTSNSTMPARRQQRQQQQEADAGPVWRPVHRYAFVQRLMRSGYLTQSSALDIFEQLTGSDSGEACCTCSFCCNSGTGGPSSSPRCRHTLSIRSRGVQRHAGRTER